MNTNPNCKDTCCNVVFNLYSIIRKCAIVLIVFCAFAKTSAYGQNTTIILNANSNGKSTYVECGTTYYFYDSGGESGNYNSNEDYSYTFESCHEITIELIDLQTEAYCGSCDYLSIYDNNESTPLATGIYGSSLPSTTTYTATSGKLYIKWKSDNGSNNRGWAATITCTGSPCPQHTLYYDITTNCLGSANTAPSSTTASYATVTDIEPSCSAAPFFRGWNTARDGSGTYYNAGDEISLLNHDVTLYARYRSTECNNYVVVNDVNTSSGYNVPFCSHIDYDNAPRSSYSQMIYSKEQITTASGYSGRGIIRKIYFDYYGPDAQDMEFDLYMANTDTSSFYPHDRWVRKNLILVASKNITFTPGWVEIELDDEFLWDGTSNLLIAMHAKTNIDINNNRKFYYTLKNYAIKYQHRLNGLILLNGNHVPTVIGNPSGYGGTYGNALPNLKLCMAPYCEPPTFLFSTSSATCALGGSYDLTALFSLSNPTGRPVTYTCNPAEATISGTTITPHVGGNITITAHIAAYNGKCAADATAILTVNCTEPSFEFSQYGVFCTISNSVSAPSYTTNSTSTSVTYSSSNEAVATVNPSTGVVTGVSEGYTTITAYLASSGNFCQKAATFVAYVSPDESCMPFTSGNCSVHGGLNCISPFYTESYFSYSYVQMLYPATELRATGLSAGRINKIAFHLYGRPSSPHDFTLNFRVFIAATNSTSLYTEWATPISGFVEKFSAAKSFSQDSWTYIELTDGFDWDGTSNIVVAVNSYGILPSYADYHFCTQNSEQLARYVAKQSSEIGGATEIPLNPTTKLPSDLGSPSLYRADINFCQDASTIILPIELSKFEAKCHNDKVYIIWTTSSEKDNEAFIIERSSNAVDFIEIARIGGYGNSIETINYQYTDKNPNTGDNYYRLVQIDTDGTRTQSEIIVAKCHDSKLDDMQVEAYPNPFNDKLTISLYNFDGQNTTIEIFDMLGKIVKSISVLNPSNYHEITISIDGLPQAAYNLRVSASGHVTNKIVVKN